MRWPLAFCMSLAIGLPAAHAQQVTELTALSLEQLLDSAQEQDVQFMVCTTSMLIMGLSKGDLMARPNMQFGGVASFVDEARGAALSLVF